MNSLHDDTKSKIYNSNNIFFVFLFVFFLAGCVTKYRPEMKLVKAEFHMPKQTMNMEVTGIRNKKGGFPSENSENFQVEVSTDEIYLRFSGVPGYQKFLLQYSGNKKVEFLPDKTFYSINGGPPIKLNFQVIAQLDTYGTFDLYALELKLPEPLSTYDVHLIGGSLSKSMAERIKKGDDDVHRFYIPFTIDGEPYAVDVSFKLQVNTSYFNIDGPA